MFGLFLGLAVAGAALLFSTSESAEEVLKKLEKDIEDFLENKVENKKNIIENFNNKYLQKKLKGRNNKLDNFYLISSEGIESLNNKIKKENEKLNEIFSVIESIKEKILNLNSESNLKEKEKYFISELQIAKEIDSNFLSNKENERLENRKKNIKFLILNLNIEVKKNQIYDRVNKLRMRIEEEINICNKYLDYYFEELVIKNIDGLISEIKLINNPELLLKLDELKDLKNSIGVKRKNFNMNFVLKEKIEKKEFFKSIGNFGLDPQQIEAVLKNEISNLVIAGAGTGKTTTLRGRVKYLTEILKVDSADILVLAYNKSAAIEIKNLLKKDGFEIDTKTFHSLGANIIRKLDNNIQIEKNTEKLIGDIFNKFLKENSDYLKSLVIYFGYFLTDTKDEFEFETAEEYQEYLKDREYKSLKNEFHRSYEEVLIANFLFKNNINYVYEKKYDIPDGYRNKYSDEKKSNNYNPDFYLPDYKIYIEHFGVDENGNVPKYWSGCEGKSATEIYWDGINWKRLLHKDLKTNLIETYSYEKRNGTLFDNLKTNLLKYDVKFEELSAEELLENIKANLKKEYNAFVNLVKSFVNYSRENNVDLEEVKRKNSDSFYSRNSTFLNLVMPILSEYEKYLSENNLIDFPDMIIKATEILQKNKYSLEYKHILVDEFQDISLTRFNLIKEIWLKNKGYLFCVGDDWQSIYKFNGSNVDIFLNLEKYTKYCEVSKIETTYRYPQSIVELSSKFIMKNPIQIVKNIKSFQNEKGKSYEFIYHTSENKLKENVKATLKRLPQNSDILILLRYNSDIEKIKGNGIKEKAGKELIYFDRLDLKIQYKTVHSAKGAEADYVLILNNEGGMKGFPSQIEDDPIFKLIKNGLDSNYPFDEERRLYYVALTRCKKKQFLFININEKSSFIKELEKEFQHPLKCQNCGGQIQFDDLKKRITCLSCSNEILESHVYSGEKCYCSNESEFVVKYSEKNQRYFLSCSNYPKCYNTKNII